MDYHYMNEDIQNRIEAILFTTGRFLTLEELGKLTRISSSGILKEALDKLKEEYKNKNNSLEILEENGNFRLNIKREYMYLTTELLEQTDFDKGTQETLALVAYKNPVLQAEIIDRRGNGAYEHIAKLKEMDLITSEKSGRTRLLKLTPKFFDYFDVAEEGLKEKFKSLEEKYGKEEKVAETNPVTETEEKEINSGAESTKIKTEGGEESTINEEKNGLDEET